MTSSACQGRRKAGLPLSIEGNIRTYKKTNLPCVIFSLKTNESTRRIFRRVLSFEKGLRSDSRIFARFARKNILSPRKVFFATYTPPQRTNSTFFTALRRRELCETFPPQSIPLSV